MSYDPKVHRGRLRRLSPEYYREDSFVHWSMTIDRRRTGWLDPPHHARVRELLCHALSRYQLVCPAYCLMPDHGHLLWVGIRPGSDQLMATAHFRTAWNRELVKAGFKLQDQPFDHVLREEKRARDAFSAVAHYIFDNPVRAGLTEDWTGYPFLGAVIPGYPEFDPRHDDFWPRFWRLYAKIVSAI